MQVVYAAGRLGALEFAIADSKDAVPSNAIVFAVCSEEHALSIQDEDVLDSLIDREFAAFQTLLRKAREVELQTSFETCQSPLENMFAANLTNSNSR